MSQPYKETVRTPSELQQALWDGVQHIELLEHLDLSALAGLDSTHAAAPATSTTQDLPVAAQLAAQPTLRSIQVLNLSCMRLRYTVSGGFQACIQISRVYLRGPGGSPYVEREPVRKLSKPCKPSRSLILQRHGAALPGVYLVVAGHLLFTRSTFRGGRDRVQLPHAVTTCPSTYRRLATRASQQVACRGTALMSFRRPSQQQRRIWTVGLANACCCLGRLRSTMLSWPSLSVTLVQQ